MTPYIPWLVLSSLGGIIDGQESGDTGVRAPIIAATVFSAFLMISCCCIYFSCIKAHKGRSKLEKIGDGLAILTSTVALAVGLVIAILTAEDPQSEKNATIKSLSTFGGWTLLSSAVLLLGQIGLSTWNVYKRKSKGSKLTESTNLLSVNNTTSTNSDSVFDIPEQPAEKSVFNM